MVSGDLNEYVITDLKYKKAPIDYFGVGTELSTSRDQPSLNGVYKLVGIKQYSKITNKYEKFYKMKTSINKISYPCPKQVFRFEKNNLFIKDIIVLEEEKIDNATPLLLQYLKEGQLIQKLPSLHEIKKYHQNQMSSLPEKFKKIGHEKVKYPIYLSRKLQKIIQKLKKEII
jgi:nicotinate phosphoribosyltransferase